MVRQLFTLVIVGFLVKIIVCSGLGRCPKQEPMENFNMTRFTGRWFEVERSFYLVELLYSCVTVEMETISNFKLNISVVSRSRWSDGITVSEGYATQTRKDPAIFVYKVNTKLPRLFSKYLPAAGAYQVIDTDYDTYAILWSCSDYVIAHNDNIWIWGRKKELNVTTRAYIYEILEVNELDPERLTLPKNGNCLD
ncbi:apolipoprotein D-like [Harmonia axyridis]|uniref:apolipoprotein D-like n=1 Tax=Harmonia axyridis TaxID=115357 RepID=UPI001E27619B|nr:apolipoprotein D-like [Harmonia axyridis]